MNSFILKTFVFFFSASICLLLHSQLNLSSIYALSLVGFAGTFLKSKKFIEADELHRIIYAGSFAGSSTIEFENIYFFFPVLSLIAMAIFNSTRFLANGFGGKLGAIAFISVLITLFIEKLWF